MKNDRNMFSPGFQGSFPMGQMNPMGPMGQMGPIGPMNPMGPMGPGLPGGMMPNMSDIENRIVTLERQLKRLDARVNRLETPYPTSTTPTHPSGPGMYQPADTADQQPSYPYQTSMQMM